MTEHYALTSKTENRPLDILIVGAGIGGLAAAVGLRRNGHHVTLYEASRFATELGAAIMIPPNSNAILQRFGIDAEEDGARPGTWFTQLNSIGEAATSFFRADTKHLWLHKGLQGHRIALHKRLMTEAMSEAGIGPSAKLYTSCRVTEVDVENGALTFEDGSVAHGDFIIGADGVKSITRSSVHDSTPFSSGKNAYRFLVDRQVILNHPIAASLGSRDGEMFIWYGQDRRIWLYPTNSNQILNVVATHPDTLSSAPSDSKDAFGESSKYEHHKEDMLKVYAGFEPRVIALLELADPASVRLWPLMDMGSLPTWVNGKLCLLGDAAHPFLPYLGQGAAMAIEDAASIAAVFRAGITRSEIPERLALYQDCRKTRAEYVQNSTRIAGRDLAPDDHDARKNREHVMKEFQPFLHSHDEFDCSTGKLRAFLHEKNKNKLVWSMPTSFGPLIERAAREKQSARRVTITFETSRTLLDNLLPKVSLGATLMLPRPATVATVSLEHTSSSDIGGGDLHQLAFYLHDVHCLRSDGTTALDNAKFLAVLFVNRSDAFSNERETLGLPTVFCDIQVQSSANEGKDWALRLSWKGIEFGAFHVKSSGTNWAASEGTATSGQKNKQAESSTSILTHRYIANPSKGASPTVDEIICIPSPNPTRGESAEQDATIANDANIEWMPHDLKTLPTLYHIITRLAELPVVEVSMVRQMSLAGGLTIDGSRAYACK